MLRTNLPERAISMCPDAEGFLFPLLNFNLCVECEMCTLVCPRQQANRERILNLPKRVYAARNKDPKTLLLSTSGAVFPIFARAILAKGGVVYGCAWAGNGLRAAHIRVDCDRDLHKLLQSKYVQSATEGTFQAVKSDLEQKLPVLYSGTPCQIAGLQLFLGENCEDLITIDLLCHGVPSPAMLAAYTDWLSRRERSPIYDLKFRDKKKSGYRAYVSFKRQDGKRYFRLAGLEPFLNGFYRELFNRESCYSCPFKQFRRTGDITLADYWGLEIQHPELTNWTRYGASLCTFNTPKGLRLESALESAAELVESTIEYAARKNPALNTPPESHRRPELRGRIYRELHESGFDWITARYLRPKYAWLHRLIPARVKNLLRFFRK